MDPNAPHDHDSDRGPTSESAPDRGLTRRSFLAGLGATAGVATMETKSGRADSSRSTSDATTGSVRRRSPAADATVHVRVYPGPVSLFAWIRNGLSSVGGREYPIHRDATAAVEEAFEQIVTYAEANSSLEDVEVLVETDDPIKLSSGPVSGLVDLSLYSQSSLLDRFRRAVHEREAVTGSCCHLLLWWNPLNYNLGYGGTRLPNKHVAAFEDEGAQTVANIGATEVWDSRAVTRNIAIHETLHTFLSPDVVRDVVGSRCDHHLGTAVKTDDDAMRVSPMATAYAGPDRLGGGTRFHGSGCYDHDSFSRHDGHEGVDRWEYTTELSEATLEAVTLYIERYLA